MKKIKTALCGFGMSGWVFHAPFIHLHEGFELYAVWERNKKLAQEQYPAIISYSSYEELLANDAIELIIVNTPNNTHYTLAKASFISQQTRCSGEAFYNFLWQKEKSLIEIAKDKNRKLSVYQNRRFDSDYLTIQDVLE
ncbi:MAG: Gfo/Idh/MocA family oxidoreductase [Chitinophagaceae bacterium]